MELVNGTSITHYCDEQHLTPKERLELFVPVCQAVQHAHQKGIIHRDLKPSNILIALCDNKAVPKIIDFGVAKATSQTLTEKTMFTQLGQVVGTIEYMSPEQAQRNQLDIDTRTDVYSLGVLLYELLTGATPFDGQRLRSAAFEEMLRIIREEEPLRPSLRLSTIDTLPSVAANRKTEPKKLSVLVRGELDWIVVKALEKDRTRRYDSASGLAQDVERYLHEQPVLAGPPSAAYRFRKFARRNRLMLAVATVVAAALLLGIIGTSWQAIRATRAERLAVAAEQRASRNLKGALDAVDQMLVRVGDETLDDLPRLEEVRCGLLEDAVRLYDRLLGDAPNDSRLLGETAVTERRKADVLLLLGRRDEARESVNRSIGLLRELAHSQDSRQLQLELSESYSLAGAITGELEPLEQSVAILNQVNTAGSADQNAVVALARTLNFCGMKFEESGKRARAEKVLSEADRLFERLLSRIENDHELNVAYAKHLINFGDFDARNGDWQAQVSKLDRAVEIGRSLIAEQRRAQDLLVCATALLNRGSAKIQQKVAPTLAANGDSEVDHADSDTDYQRSAELFRELVRDYPAVPLYRERLAGALAMRAWANRSDYDRATRLSEESLQILDGLVQDYPTLHEYSSAYGAALCNEANRLRMLGRELQRAEQLARQAIVQQSQGLERNPEDPKKILYLANHYAVLAEILSERGSDSAELVDVCTCGLQVGDRLAQISPENQYVEFVTRRLREMKQAAERRSGASGNSSATR